MHKLNPLSPGAPWPLQPFFIPYGTPTASAQTPSLNSSSPQTLPKHSLPVGTGCHLPPRPHVSSEPRASDSEAPASPALPGVVDTEAMETLLARGGGLRSWTALTPVQDCAWRRQRKAAEAFLGRGGGEQEDQTDVGRTFLVEAQPIRTGGHLCWEWHVRGAGNQRWGGAGDGRVVTEKNFLGEEARVPAIIRPCRPATPSPHRPAHRTHGAGGKAKVHPQEPFVL